MVAAKPTFFAKSTACPDPLATQRLLVIRLDALGDFVMSLRSLQAIRRHFPETLITLLTTRPFVKLARASGCVDDVWIDTRPKIGRIHHVLQFRRRMIRAHFDLVIDLQGSDRTAMYFHMLLSHQPPWSGYAHGCRYPLSRSALRETTHVIEREDAQLCQLGITPLKKIGLNWMLNATGLKQFRIGASDLVIVPAGAQKNPERHWPIIHYIELAQTALKWGWRVTVIGMAADTQICQAIKNACPEVRDLSSQANFLEIAIIGSRAGYAIGNDVGLLHLLVSSGCACLMLSGSDTLCQPVLLDDVQALHQHPIHRIGVQQVLEASDLKGRMRRLKRRLKYKAENQPNAALASSWEEAT